MAKEVPKIVSAIRMPADRETKKGRRLFKEGDEEELAKVATPAQLKAWTEAGAITGFVAKAEEKKK